MNNGERFEKLQEISDDWEIAKGHDEKDEILSAAIGGLIQICKEQEERITELESELKAIERRVNRVKFECLNEEW